jgi:hypothetical protein
MLYVLAAALLLTVVALLALRPLFAPSEAGTTDGSGELPVDSLETAIAERRARMAAREAEHP